MSVLIAASAIRTCFGDGDATFSALLRGASGICDLRYADSVKTRVNRAYHIKENGEEALFRAGRWLTACIREALTSCSGVDPQHQRVVAIIGTGLRELRSVERCAVESIDFPLERMHFGSAVREACPDIQEVVTLSNACSAGGHALALAQDLIELGDADAVVAAATDSMTESMLAMIGRFVDSPTENVRPFDASRTGALLGDGAASMIVVPEGANHRPLARLLSTGLSCDATHETAPHIAGILRATQDAFKRAARSPAEVDLVVTHGTGTALNDPTEAALIRRILASDRPGPLITAVKGATGHTSGSAALINVDVAIRCLINGIVPPIVGLCRPLSEGEGLRFVTGTPVEAHLRLAHVNAFGFGGVNAVTLVEAAA